MFSHTAIVQSSGELPTSLVNRILGGRLKKVKIMHAISSLVSHTLSYALTLLSFFVVFATFWDQLQLGAIDKSSAQPFGTRND